MSDLEVDVISSPSIAPAASAAPIPKTKPNKSSVKAQANVSLPPSLPSQPNQDKNLNWLTGVDYLKINQKVELTEVVSAGCCETANNYMIYTKQGQHVANAVEKGSACLKCLCRNHCKNSRGFTMAVKSFKDGQSFLCQRWYKPCVACCWPLCLCCSDQIIITSPDGEVYGDCQEACAFPKPRYLMNDARGNRMFKVVGPCCTCNLCPCLPCCKKITFTIYDSQGYFQGKVYKKWAGFAKEMLTDADTFCVEFNSSMTNQGKASIIGLTFLIDFMYFED